MPSRIVSCNSNPIVQLACDCYRIKYRIIFKHFFKSQRHSLHQTVFTCQRRMLLKVAQGKVVPWKSTIIHRCLTGSGVELIHLNWRRFSYAYQHFFLDITTVHYEDITENDRRVKFLWKALENFTNGKITDCWQTGCLWGSLRRVFSRPECLVFLVISF